MFYATECSEWLRQRNIAEAPHGMPVSRFELPKEAGRIFAFARSLFLAFGDFPGGLLVFTDWALYRPDEMALIDSLRRGHGEPRPLIEAPGHIFTAAEVSQAIGQTYLPIIFAWSACMYLASGLATVYFREGDLVDFWTSDSRVAKNVDDVIEQYGYELLTTAEANQSLERIGEQLVMMEQTVLFATEVMNQPTLPSTGLALS